MELWYRAPASSWTQALLLGNGRLGAMVYGGTNEETICLNEDTFWSGYPCPLDLDDKTEIFEQIRLLVIGDRLEEAQKLFERELNIFPGESYQPVGSLAMRFEHPGEVSEYRRGLDLDSAVSRVSYRAGETSYTREILVSYPHQVMAMRLEADKPGALNFTLEFASKLHCRPWAESDTQWLLTQAPSRVEPDYSSTRPEPVEYNENFREQGMKALTALRVVPVGGEVQRAGGCLTVTNADSAVIYLTVRTSFRGFDKQPNISEAELRHRCLEDLHSAPDFDTLRQEHVKDYQELYHRVDFHLQGENREDLPTDQRLLRFAEDHSDVGIYPLLFQYGRYLTIAASRPGTQAMNLQGIWNAEIRPSRGGSYILNGSTQMNYWPTLPCALEECREPLDRLIRELSVTGAETAEKLYAARGYVAHHSTDLWRFAWPVGNHAEKRTFWNMSAPGLCRYLFDRYAYTLDRHYLRDTAYPLMRGAAVFLLELLHAGEDSLLRKDPTSSAAMVTELIRELFQNCIKACAILETDEDFAGQLKNALNQLEPTAAEEEGVNGNFAREMRQWIRRNEGSRALEILNTQLRPAEESGGCYANLFCPPFRVDGTFGTAAGIADMLLQSGEGRVDLLPALPDAWTEGTVSGLRARGALTVDISWNKDTCEAVIVSETNQTVEVSLFGGETEEVRLQARTPCHIERTTFYNRNERKLGGTT